MCNFVDLKKHFKVIIALVCVSVCGIFYLQYDQFIKTYQAREDDIRTKIISTISKIGDEVSVKIFLKNKEYNIENNNYSDLGTSESLEYKYFTKDIFTVKELKDLITYNLMKVGLDKIKFEFAIVNNNRLVKKNFSTYKYYKLVRKKVGYKIFSYPIYYTNYLAQDFIDSKYKKPSEKIYMIVPNFKYYVLGQLKWYVICSVFFSVIMLTSFFFTLRQVISQTKLTEVKNNFFNNITHELKTPISTVSLAADALLSKFDSSKEEVNRDPKIKYFTNIIKEENARLENLVDNILNTARMENKTFKFHFTNISMHEIIMDLLNKFKLKLKEKNAKVELKLEAKKNLLFVDKVHFMNAISNLIDNSIKYSKENQHLVLNISTYNFEDKIFLKIQDNGIGMSKHTQKKVFEKFYRASKGNVHSTKGHGLGISYANNVFRGHKASFKMDSIVNKGSIFTVSLSYIS